MYYIYGMVQAIPTYRVYRLYDRAHTNIYAMFSLARGHVKAPFLHFHCMPQGGPPFMGGGAGPAGQVLAGPLFYLIDYS